MLGIWWPRLTRAGALAGLLVGGSCASTAVLLTVTGAVEGGLAGALLAQPAAWSVPLAFAVMVVVSLLTPRTMPPGALAVLVRLHAPEALRLGAPGAGGRGRRAGRRSGDRSSSSGDRSSQ